MAALDTTTVLEQLRRDLPHLSGREARAARHLLANYPMAGLTTVAELAAQSGVSTATVLRLIKRLGFPVYADFQAALRSHLEETLQSPLIRFGERQDLERSASDPFFDRFIDAMLGHMHDLRGSLPAEEFETVTALLADPRRDIHILGGRYSSNLGAYVADLLTAVRGRVFKITGQTQIWPQHLLDMGKASVLVIFDVRRYQQDVIGFAEAAAQRGATVVLVTDIWQSPAARAADHVLTFQVESPSIFDVLTIGMALSEALVGAVANRLGRTGLERIEALEDLRRPFAPQEAGLNRADTFSKRGR
jgi:DNA-binding MurR/RpiR family transcriptional regulator